MKLMCICKSLSCLDKLMTRLDEFRSYGSDEHPDFYKWRSDVLALLARQIGVDSAAHRNFNAIDFRRSISDELYNSRVSEAFLVSLKKAERILLEVRNSWAQQREAGMQKIIRAKRIFKNPWVITILGGIIVSFIWFLITSQQNMSDKSTETKTQRQDPRFSINGSYNSILIEQKGE